MSHSERRLPAGRSAGSLPALLAGTRCRVFRFLRFIEKPKVPGAW